MAGIVVGVTEEGAALDDPDAEPRDGDEAAAVARYERLLDGWRHAERGR